VRLGVYITGSGNGKLQATAGELREGSCPTPLARNGQCEDSQCVTASIDPCGVYESDPTTCAAPLYDMKWRRRSATKFRPAGEGRVWTPEMAYGYEGLVDNHRCAEEKDILLGGA